MTTFKICTKCKETKELKDFHKDCTTKSGLKFACKECYKISKSKYDSLNKDKNKAYALKNKEHSREYRKQYNIENKEVMNAKNRARYQLTKESVKMQQQIYNQTPAGKMVKTNSVNKRRALRVARADGTIPDLVTAPLTKELLDLLHFQKSKCKMCDCNISDGANLRHLDHVVPLSKGGMHSINNVQWLCATCNLQKSDKIGA